MKGEFLWDRFQSWIKSAFQTLSLPKTNKLEMELNPPPRKASPPEVKTSRFLDLDLNETGHLVGSGFVNGI